jgi:hypothetical protein
VIRRIRSSASADCYLHRLTRSVASLSMEQPLPNEAQTTSNYGLIPDSWLVCIAQRLQEPRSGLVHGARCLAGRVDQPRLRLPGDLPQSPAAPLVTEYSHARLDARRVSKQPRLSAINRRLEDSSHRLADQDRLTPRTKMACKVTKAWRLPTRDRRSRAPHAATLG